MNFLGCLSGADPEAPESTKRDLNRASCKKEPESVVHKGICFHNPKKQWFPICISFSRGLVSGAMLVSRMKFPTQLCGDVHISHKKP